MLSVASQGLYFCEFCMSIECVLLAENSDKGKAVISRLCGKPHLEKGAVAVFSHF